MFCGLFLQSGTTTFELTRASTEYSCCWALARAIGKNNKRLSKNFFASWRHIHHGRDYSNTWFFPWSRGVNLQSRELVVGKELFKFTYFICFLLSIDNHGKLTAMQRQI